MQGDGVDGARPCVLQVAVTLASAQGGEGVCAERALRGEVDLERCRVRESKARAGAGGVGQAEPCREMAWMVRGRVCFKWP
jgi:hypothetical protein